MFEKVDPAIMGKSRRGATKAFREMEIGDVIEVPYSQMHSTAKAVGITVTIHGVDGRFYAQRVK